MKGKYDGKGMGTHGFGKGMGSHFCGRGMNRFGLSWRGGGGKIDNLTYYFYQTNKMEAFPKKHFENGYILQANFFFLLVDQTCNYHPMHHCHFLKNYF